MTMEENDVPANQSMHDIFTTLFVEKPSYNESSKKKLCNMVDEIFVI